MLFGVSVGYMIFIIVYRPYKYSFKVHQVSIVINHMIYMISLGMISIINMDIVIEEYYLLVFSYLTMTLCMIIVIMSFIRCYY